MAHRSFESQVVKWRYLIFCVVAGFIAFSASISHLITDSYLLFHEGEYVGLLWHLRSFQNGTTEFPVLIHGAMDYLPAMLASFVYGDDHVIVGTRTVNTFITWICWVIFLDLCHIVTSRSSQRVQWIAIALLVLFLITPKLGSQALAFQQSFLGVRDLFLVVTVWCVAQHTYSINAIRGHVFLLMASVSTAVAFFWSYDRGIISLGFLGIVLLGLVYNRKCRSAAITVLATGFSALLLDQMRLLGSLSDNMQNIVYWIGNANEVSGTSIFADKMTFVTIALVLIFCMTAVISVFVKKFYRDKDGLFLVLGILVVQALLLKTVMTRPGMPRLSWAIWPSILMMIYCASRVHLTEFKVAHEAESNPFKNVPHVYKAYAVVFLLMSFFMSPLMFSYGSFIKNLFRPKFDTEIVSAEVNSLSRKLSQHDHHCVLGWTNEGVVALLLKKRFCTRFPYAVYVAKDEEANYLEQLKADSPGAVIVSVRGVTMLDIGSGRMENRLPGANGFVEDKYPEKVQIGRYTVASTGRPETLPP